MRKKWLSKLSKIDLKQQVMQIDRSFISFALLLLLEFIAAIVKVLMQPHDSDVNDQHARL